MYDASITLSDGRRLGYTTLGEPKREIPGSTPRIVLGRGHLLADDPAVVEEIRRVLFGES